MCELGKVCTTVDRRINSLEGAMKRTPATENGKVRPRRPPRRQPNRATRTREHLTPAEVEKLITSAGTVGRYWHLDSTMLLLACRPGRRLYERVEASVVASVPSDRHAPRPPSEERESSRAPADR